MSLECKKLHQLVNELPKYNIKNLEDSTIPSNGIYFIMEKGESYSGYHRIVRIGFNRKKGDLPNKIQCVLLGNSSLRKHMTKAIKKRYKPLKEAEDLNYFLNAYMRDRLKISFIKIRSSNVRKRMVRRAIKSMETAKDYEPSSKWLGKSSSKLNIRKKGLWHLKNFKVIKSQKLDEKDLEFLMKRTKNN